LEKYLSCTHGVGQVVPAGGPTGRRSVRGSVCPLRSGGPERGRGGREKLSPASGRSRKSSCSRNSEGSGRGVRRGSERNSPGPGREEKSAMRAWAYGGPGRKATVLAFARRTLKAQPKAGHDGNTTWPSRFPAFPRACAARFPRWPRRARRRAEPAAWRMRGRWPARPACGT